MIHKIDYKIYGDDIQIVSIELDPQETVIAEAGSMGWMVSDIKFEAKMGDGSQPDKNFGKLLDVGKRVLTRESIFRPFYQWGTWEEKGEFAALPRFDHSFGFNHGKREILCQKDAFLCRQKAPK